MGVFSFSTPDANDAMRPMMVRSPVFTTRPCAVPAVGPKGGLGPAGRQQGRALLCELKEGAVRRAGRLCGLEGG